VVAMRLAAGVSHYGYIKSKKPRGDDALRKDRGPIVGGGG